MKLTAKVPVIRMTSSLKGCHCHSSDLVLDVKRCCSPGTLRACGGLPRLAVLVLRVWLLCSVLVFARVWSVCFRAGREPRASSMLANALPLSRTPAPVWFFFNFAF